MKKQLRIISAILSVIMMLAVVPFSAFATTSTWEDGTLLFEKTGLFNTDTISKAEGITISQIAADATGVTVSGDTATATANTTSWIHCGGISTNIEMNENSKYTIEMDVNFADSGRAMIGFVGENLSEMRAFYFNGTEAQNYYGILKGSTVSGKYGSKITGVPRSNVPDGADRNIQFEINGYVVSLYVGGTKYGEFNYGESSSPDTAPAGWDSTLGIAVTAVPTYKATGETSGTVHNEETVIQVKNISVHAGNIISNPPTAPEEDTRLTGSWNDGTVLLQKNGLFNTDTVSKVEGLEISEIAATAAGVSKDTDGDSFTATADTTAWMPLGGISTNLKMDADSKYTIEMDVNFADSGRAMIGFVGNELFEMHAFYFNGTVLTDAYGIHGTSGWTGRNGKYTSSKQATPTSKNKNDHTLQFEIDGYVVSVYMDGTKYGEFNFGESSAPITAPEGWDSTLGIAITAVPTYDSIVHSGETVIEVKNIAVYAGNVAGPKITFESEDGTTLGVQSATIGDEITEFPTVDAPEGKIVKWFHKGTNIVVNTPYVVSTAKATLVAKVIDLNAIEVAGMQYTTKSSANTQSIRFIATIHTLQAMDTGFVVTAKYMDGSTLKEKEFKVNSKTVYTAITTTENGTVKSVTAEELGGTYLVAISIDDVPATIGQIDFYVTALLKVSDTKTVESAEAIFSMKDGAFLENATLLQ